MTRTTSAFVAMMLVGFGLFGLPSGASAAAATQLVVSVVNASTTAGTTDSITVTAEDSTGATDTGYMGNVVFTSTDTNAILPAAYTFTSMDMGTHTFDVTFATVGTQTVSASGTTISGTTPPVTVSAGPAANVVFQTPPPTSVTAGTPFSVGVKVEDQYGNAADSYTGTLSLTSADAAATLPSPHVFTAADAGSYTFNGVVLKTAANQTVSAGDGTLRPAVAPVAVTPAVTSHLLVTAPSSATAGSALSYTVTALDQYGNMTPTYVGTVHFTSTDAAASLPADYTFVSGDNGSASFSATLNTATHNNATQTITATDTATPSITGSASLPVSPSTATTLTVTGPPVPPATYVAGSNLPLTVTALDAHGNTDTNYLGTVQLTSSDPRFQTVTYTFTAADQGQHSFASVSYETVGSQTITATDTTTSSITGRSAATNVVPAATAKFAFSTVSGAVAGTAFPLTVTAEDQYGNTTPSYTGKVAITSTDGTAHLPTSYTFTAGDGGVHTFTPNSAPGAFTLYQSGKTITVADSATPAITGTTPTLALAIPNAGLSGPGSAVQLTKSGAKVSFTLDLSSSGTPLTLPSDLLQPATVYGPGSYTLDCPTSLVTCTLENGGSATLSGTGSFTLVVDVAQKTAGYFDPQTVGLTLNSPSAGDIAVPATSKATATVISEVNPAPGLAIAVSSPGSVSFPAGGTMTFPVALTANGSPVNAAGDITVHYSVSCPLPSSVMTCSSPGTVKLAAGLQTVGIPVAVAAVDRNAYFPKLPVGVTVTAIDAPGKDISIVGSGEAQGYVSSTVAAPVVTLSGDPSVTLNSGAGVHRYKVSIASPSGGAEQVAVPLIVTFTAGGTPGFAAPAIPGVDFASNIVTGAATSCPTGKTCVIFTPGANGIDPSSQNIAVDFLSRTVHGANRSFEVQLTGTNLGTLGSATIVQTTLTDTLNYGYWLVGTDGGVFTEGAARFEGSASGLPLGSPVVALTPSPTGRGYWLVTSKGGVFAYGDAHFYGSLFGDHLAAKIVGIAATPTGHGYWLVGGDGGLFSFGDARFYGSLSGTRLVGPIVGIQATRTGRGYYMVGSDGGVFAFGDARFHGSLPVYCGVCALSSPILGLALTPTGNGYWEAAQNGGVFAFGDARYYGSAFNPSGHKFYVAITATLSGNGYWLLATDGSVVNLGDAKALGSVRVPATAPIENMAGD